MMLLSRDDSTPKFSLRLIWKSLLSLGFKNDALDSMDIDRLNASSTED